MVLSAPMAIIGAGLVWHFARQPAAPAKAAPRK
jgi:hypothetical protein